MILLQCQHNREEKTIVSSFVKAEIVLRFLLDLEFLIPTGFTCFGIYVYKKYLSKTFSSWSWNKQHFSERFSNQILLQNLNGTIASFCYQI